MRFMNEYLGLSKVNVDWKGDVLQYTTRQRLQPGVLFGGTYLGRDGNQSAGRLYENVPAHVDGEALPIVGIKMLVQFAENRYVTTEKEAAIVDDGGLLSAQPRAGEAGTGSGRRKGERPRDQLETWIPLVWDCCNAILSNFLATGEPKLPAGRSLAADEARGVKAKRPNPPSKRKPEKKKKPTAGSSSQGVTDVVTSSEDSDSSSSSSSEEDSSNEGSSSDEDSSDEDTADAAEPSRAPRPSRRKTKSPTPDSGDGSPDWLPGRKRAKRAVASAPEKSSAGNSAFSKDSAFSEGFRKTTTVVGSSVEDLRTRLMMEPRPPGRFRPTGKDADWGYFTAGTVISPPRGGKYERPRHHSTLTPSARMLFALGGVEAVMLALTDMARSPFMGPPLLAPIGNYDLTIITDTLPAAGKIMIVLFPGQHGAMINTLRKECAGMGRMHGFSANQSAQPFLFNNSFHKSFESSYIRAELSPGCMYTIEGACGVIVASNTHNVAAAWCTTTSVPVATSQRGTDLKWNIGEKSSAPPLSPQPPAPGRPASPSRPPPPPTAPAGRGSPSSFVSSVGPSISQAPSVFAAAATGDVSELRKQLADLDREEIMTGLKTRLAKALASVSSWKTVGEESVAEKLELQKTVSDLRKELADAIEGKERAEAAQKTAEEDAATLRKGMDDLKAVNVTLKAEEAKLKVLLQTANDEKAALAMQVAKDALAQREKDRGGA